MRGLEDFGLYGLNYGSLSNATDPSKKSVLGRCPPFTDFLYPIFKFAVDGFV